MNKKTVIIKITGWSDPEPQNVLTPSGNPTAWARGIRNEIREIVPGIRFRWDRDQSIRRAGYALATHEDAEKIKRNLGNGVDVIHDGDKYHSDIMKWIGVAPPEVISLRIPASLKSNLESQAKARGLSLNAYLKNILKKVAE